MDAISFLALSFATYRVSEMLANEEGPFALFERFRNFFLTANWISRGVRCPKCLSFWVGQVLAAVMLYPNPTPNSILYGLAASGATLILMRYWAR